jgi:hypothetical protein
MTPIRETFEIMREIIADMATSIVIEAAEGKMIVSIALDMTGAIATTATTTITATIPMMISGDVIVTETAIVELTGRTDGAILEIETEPEGAGGRTM